MPVIETASNRHNTRKGNEPYGCHNRKIGDGYAVLTRHYYTHGTYYLKSESVAHTMSKGCRYDRSLGDIRCEGCSERGNGEHYAKMVREKGK